MATRSCATIELAPIEFQARYPPLRHDVPAEERPSFGGSRRTLAQNGVFESGQSQNVVEVTQKWNDPKINVFRVAACSWGFLVMGANDVVYGALIPYIEEDYGVDYVVLSIVFLSRFAGYIASATLNDYFHQKLGLRGIPMLCAGCHIASHLTIVFHPPYMVTVMAFIVAGFGHGLFDSALNGWISTLANSTRILSFTGAFYAFGAMLSPLIATIMITKAHIPWYSFFYVMLGMSIIELVSLTWSFWNATDHGHRGTPNETEAERENTLTAALFRMPAARVSWLCAFLMFCYVGIENALGGWIVLFMATARGGEAFESGLTATWFWLGLTLGRIVLGFATPRLGVKIALTVYITTALGLGLVFVLVPRFLVSAIVVALQGFFLGPLYPGVVIVASKLLPEHLKVRVIGFATAMGGCGAALLPFSVGVLAQLASVQVLQPTVMAITGIMLASWLCLPKIDKRQD
ncbi:MFS domain-containing protein [Fusarium falciforme]|uniref:MFS domain-containing protein n=1 Tax=Fusarium falciforme TaxID=195108 RepID=UPI002301E39E|nr:MFS domain-containing protein [Fusarium falciforme]WAO96544.1 MFS domain-containing protein [Fusarium falciforme]